MKKFCKPVLTALAFLLILAVLFCLLNVFFDGYLYEDVSKVTNDYRGIYGERENSLDVLFMGDSECYCAVSPMEIWRDHGISSYCLSASAQNVQDIYEYFNSVLDYQSPSVVFLETNCIFEETTLEESIRSSIRIASPAAANHDTWRRIPVLSPGADMPELLLDDTKGYYFRPIVSAWEGEEYMIPTEDREPIPHYSRKALDRLTERCRQENIELVLLSMPAPLLGTWPRHNTIQDYADANGLTYIDLNLMDEELGLDWTIHTRDSGDHLNHGGAVLVSDYLGSWLADHYDLPDHRGDPDFCEWEISLQNYQQIVEENEENWKRQLRDPVSPDQ